MRFLLMLLVVINLALFAVNFMPSVSPPGHALPVTEPGVAALKLVENTIPVAYSSSSGVSNSSCYTIGPYITERSAQLVMARIRNYGLGVQMRTLETLETLNYLVYIPAQTSLSQAKTIVDDLNANSVQQSLIIDDGPYRNAISLGFFDNTDKAMRHAEYIRYLGYDARYTEQKSKRKVFWLDYDEPLGTNTPVLAWSKAVDSSSSPQLIPRACSNVQ